MNQKTFISFAGKSMYANMDEMKYVVTNRKGVHSCTKFEARPKVLRSQNCPQHLNILPNNESLRLSK